MNQPLHTDALREADRLMTICNACRYCEGLCAVFPAMEMRRTFAAGGTDDESVVIAHSLWVREFESNPDVLGRSVTLGAAGSARIIGVAPPHFVGARRGDVGLMGPGVEIWIPLTAARRAFTPLKERSIGVLDDDERYFTLIGRMRPDLA